MRQIIFCIFILLLTISCGQTNDKTLTEVQKNNFTLDIQTIPTANNSNSVVLKYDTTSFNLFPEICKNAKSTNLTIDEINEIDKLTYDCISKCNESLLDFNKYKRQYVPVLNDKGEKIVWINYFCDNISTDWLNHPVSVMDGGECFFQLKINLKTKKYFDFMVNGVG